MYAAALRINDRVRYRPEKLAGSKLTREGVLVIRADRVPHPGDESRRRARPPGRVGGQGRDQPGRRVKTRPTKASKERVDESAAAQQDQASSRVTRMTATAKAPARWFGAIWSTWRGRCAGRSCRR